MYFDSVCGVTVRLDWTRRVIKMGSTWISRTWACLLFSFVLWSGVFPGAAAAVHPTHDYQKLIHRFDRGNSQSFYSIYADKMGAYFPQDSRYRQIRWHCGTRDSSTGGSCSWWSSNDVGRQSTIVLRFTEKRSQISVDLQLRGHSTPQFAGSGSGCGVVTVPIQASAPPTCGSSSSVGRSLGVWVPADELQKLPTGGIWTAKLVLDMYNNTHYQVTWTTDLEFTVTDRQNIEVYLPAFGNANALVDLNLRTSPLAGAGGSVSGTTHLDMCLYDGYNSNSSSFELRFTDNNSIPGRAPELFSVLHWQAGGATDAGNRIDYTITMLSGGSQRQLRNGQTFTLNAINAAEIRAVRIPNVFIPVVCTPTPVTLNTASFNHLGKRPGRYHGTLSIIFTPSL